MQNLPFITSKDDRRILYEYIEDETFKAAKVVVALSEIPIGDHYHLKKEEVFFLLYGSFKELHIGKDIDYNVDAPCKIKIERGVYHKFILEIGSVLLCVTTAKFDINDEIK